MEKSKTINPSDKISSFIFSMLIPTPTLGIIFKIQGALYHCDTVKSVELTPLWA
jgi:hypothetical protein